MEKDESRIGLFARTDPESVAKSKKAWSDGGKKGAETRRRRTQMRKMLENMDDVREESISKYVEDNPGAFDDMYKMLFDKALEG